MMTIVCILRLIHVPNSTKPSTTMPMDCVCVDAVSESALGAFDAVHGKVKASSNIECPQDVVNANA
jgi:hypothetical protein